MAANVVWKFRKRYCPRISNRLITSKSSLLFLILSEKSFFSHFDAQTIDFLGKIQPLLADLEICLNNIPPNYLNNFRTILITLAPMLDGIESLYCYHQSLFPMVKELLFRDNEKLAKLKMLDINIANIDNIESEETGFYAKIHRYFKTFMQFPKRNNKKWSLPS